MNSGESDVPEILKSKIQSVKAKGWAISWQECFRTPTTFVRALPFGNTNVTYNMCNLYTVRKKEELVITVLNETLVELREKKGLTRQQTALQLGVSYEVYKNWEKGRTVIPADRLLAICQVLNISADRFLNYHHSHEWYVAKYKEAEGLINYVQRDVKNKEMVLWLFNEFVGEVDGIVLMSSAYACLPPAIRSHIASLIWTIFDDEYKKPTNQMPQISKIIKSSETEYRRILNELDDKAKRVQYGTK